MAESPHLELSPPPPALTALLSAMTEVLADLASVRAARICTLTVGDGRSLPTLLVEVDRALSAELSSRLGGEIWTRLNTAHAAIPGLNVMVMPAGRELVGFADLPVVRHEAVG